MSKVSSEETAISSADVDDVTAMKRRSSIRPAPPLPSRVMAVAGEERPAPLCAAVNGSGYVGKLVDPVRAAQPSPIAVANANGMPYHAMPPKMYALTDVSGRDAIARCQYAWSSQTVEKPATKRSIAKMRPPFDLNVKYDPS